MAYPIGLLITDTHLSEGTIEVNVSIFQQAIVKCKELELNVIWHGGDIFESRKGQPEIVLNAFKFILDTLLANGIMLYVIPGNHDKVSYVGDASYLDAFTSHAALMVASPYGTVEFGNIHVHFLPYYDEQLMYLEKLNALLGDVRGGVQNILITHIGLDNVLNNKGTVTENGLDAHIFNRFDLVLVGHYHNRHFVNEHIIYVGSTHQANFGEDEEKGATIIYDDLSYSFVVFDCPIFRTVDIRPEDLNAALIKQIEKVEGEGRYIRVKVKGDVEAPQMASIDKLKELGVKVEIVRDSYKAMDIQAAKTVQANTLDIESAYHEWAAERKIESPEVGLQAIKHYI